MINGVSTQPLLGSFRPEVVLAGGRFRPNGSDAITIYGGELEGLFTVASAGADSGEYVVTFDSKLKFPRQPTIIAGATCADLADNLFEVALVGDWDNANHKFTIGATQDDATSGVPAPFDVPSDAGNWISFLIMVTTTDAPR